MGENDGIAFADFHISESYAFYAYVFMHIREFGGDGLANQPVGRGAERLGGELDAEMRPEALGRAGGEARR